MPYNEQKPELNTEVLPDDTQFEFSLTNDGAQAQASHRAIIKRSGDGDKYREVAVEIYDAKGNLDACLIVGLDSATLEPVIHCTTGGYGLGDMNVAIRPMRPAEDAVEVDTNNCQSQPAPTNQNRQHK